MSYIISTWPEAADVPAVFHGHGISIISAAVSIAVACCTSVVRLVCDSTEFSSVRDRERRRCGRHQKAGTAVEWAQRSQAAVATQLHATPVMQMRLEQSLNSTTRAISQIQCLGIFNILDHLLRVSGPNIVPTSRFQGWMCTFLSTLTPPSFLPATLSRSCR